MKRLRGDPVGTVVGVVAAVLIWAGVGGVLAVTGLMVWRAVMGKGGP